jgi:hypothetical protein
MIDSSGYIGTSLVIDSERNTVVLNPTDAAYRLANDRAIRRAMTRVLNEAGCIIGCIVALPSFLPLF